MPDAYDPRRAGPEDSWTVLWRRKLVILGVTLLAAAAAFGISQVVPERFESDASIRVVVPVSGETADPEGTVNASNDLARQYAQLADTAPVVEAARRLDGGAGVKTDEIEASTVADQNIISLSVRADSPEASRLRTNAVTSALLAYIDRVNTAQAERFEEIIRDRLRPVEEQIRAIQSQLRGPTGSSASAQETAARRRNDLNSLLAERARTRVQLASGVASVNPTVQELAKAGAGSKTQPKPALYTVGAALIALLVSAQLCLLAARRRRVA